MPEQIIIEKTSPLSFRNLTHEMRLGDARDLHFLKEKSVHLIITSPPYWSLKRYNDTPDQLGHIEDYELFLEELNKVWEQVYRALVPGGRMVIVVGDVAVSRKSLGRHFSVSFTC